MRKVPTSPPELWPLAYLIDKPNHLTVASFRARHLTTDCKDNVMSDKSHASMEHKLCPICGKDYETGAVLLHKQMRQPETVTGWRICGECQTMLDDDDRIALVVVVPRPEWARDRKAMRAEEANRTGDILWLRRSAFRALFGTSDIGEGGRLLPMAFIDAPQAAELSAHAYDDISPTTTEAANDET